MSGQRAASILRGGGETRVVRRLGAVSRVVASRRERRGSRPVPGHRAKSRQEARKGADGGSHARGREIRRGGGEDPRANAGTRAYRNVPFAAEEELGQNMAAVAPSTGCPVGEGAPRGSL